MQFKRKHPAIRALDLDFIIADVKEELHILESIKKAPYVGWLAQIVISCLNLRLRFLKWRQIRLFNKSTLMKE